MTQETVSEDSLLIEMVGLAYTAWGSGEEMTAEKYTYFAYVNLIEDRQMLMMQQFKYQSIREDAGSFQAYLLY